MSNSKEGWQGIMNQVMTVCEEYGIKLNKNKTKTMVINVEAYRDNTKKNVSV